MQKVRECSVAQKEIKKERNSEEMVRPPLNIINEDSNRVPELKKGAWSEEEDGKLIAYIHRYGIWNWNQMPKAAGLVRSGKSCRLRWMNYLRPNIRHGDFTRDEENVIIKWHKLLGNKWSSIAAKLPGRTDNEIKNVWNTYLKKRTTSSDKQQRPKMSAAAPEKTNQHSIDNKSLSSSRETAVSSSSSIDNRAESESEVEGLCFRAPELQHDEMLFDDMFEQCGGFLTNPYYYHQDSLTNEWFIDDLWTL